MERKKELVRRKNKRGGVRNVGAESICKAVIFIQVKLITTNRLHRKEVDNHALMVSRRNSYIPVQLEIIWINMIGILRRCNINSFVGDMNTHCRL